MPVISVASSRCLSLARCQRLRALGVVPVDGDCFHSHFPGLHESIHDFLDGDVLRHVHRLGNGAGNEGLHRAHHLDVPHVVNRAGATLRLEGAIEHRQVLGADKRRALDGPILIDVLGYGLDLLRPGSPAFASAAGTVLFTIFMTPPPTSFLNFTRARSGSTPVVSQSIMKPIVPVGASTVACAFRYP